MAVLGNLVLAASVLTPLVAAIPMPGPNKRAIYTNTVTEIAWVTVEETTTVWVDPSTPTQAPVTPASSTDSVAAVASVEATLTPSTLQTLAAAPQAPPSSVPTVSPVAAYTPSAETTPTPVVSSSVSPVTAPAASSSSVASLVAPATMTLQAKATVDGSCEGSGNACQGDVTHWDGGLGACGWNVNSDSDYAIALPFAFMGTQSNGNPYCGRSVTLFNPTSGATVQATVGDKCMGCVDRSIDCTNVLFNAIIDGKGDGRLSGIQWWLN